MPLVLRDSAFEFAPTEIEDPIAYLERFGLPARDVETWSCSLADEHTQPVCTFSVQIVRHVEMHEHTWYVLECSLKLPDAEAAMTWTVKRRLSHLRQDLHDKVKTLLGSSYAELFANTPFARHGGVPGTTERLNAWLDVLLGLVNKLCVRPSAVLVTLQFFEPPDPQGESPDVDATDYSEFVRLAAAARKEAGDLDRVDSATTALDTRHSEPDVVVTESMGMVRWWWWMLPIPLRRQENERA